MLTALAGLVVQGVACSSDDNTSGTQTATATHPPAVSATATPTSSPTATPVASTSAPTSTPSPVASVCQGNPDPATPAQVVVSQPAANALVTSPLTVAGQINAVNKGAAAGLITSVQQSKLTALLQIVQYYLNAGNTASAKSALNNYISWVQLNSGKSINAAYAALLINWAQHLYNRL